MSDSHEYDEVDFCEESGFVAFLGMVKTSKNMKQVPLVRCCNAAERAAIEYHYRNNMVQNQIRENGLLAASVPSSAWPLILKKFSDMPDVLYCLLRQKHGAMIGPTRHGCKRKQHFGEGLETFSTTDWFLSASRISMAVLTSVKDLSSRRIRSA